MLRCFYTYFLFLLMTNIKTCNYQRVCSNRLRATLLPTSTRGSRNHRSSSILATVLVAGYLNLPDYLVTDYTLRD